MDHFRSTALKFLLSFLAILFYNRLYVCFTAFPGAGRPLVLVSGVTTEDATTAEPRWTGSTIDILSIISALNTSGWVTFPLVFPLFPLNNSSTTEPFSSTEPSQSSMTWLSSTWSSTSPVPSSTGQNAVANVIVTNATASTTEEPSESDSGTDTALIAGAGAGAAAAVGTGAAVAAVVAVKLTAASAAVAPGAAYAAAGTGQAAASIAGAGSTAGASAAGNASSMAGAGQTVSAFHSGPAVLNGAPPPGTTLVNVGPV